MRYFNKALYSSTFCEFLAIYFHQEGDRSFHNLATDAANQGCVSCKTVRILTDEPQLKDLPPWRLSSAKVKICTCEYKWKDVQ